MPKSNHRKTAELIVKHYATNAEQEVAQVVDGEIPVDKNGDPKKHVTGYRVMLLDVLGYTLATNGDTLEDAESNMADLLEADLKDGKLVLSDTWVEDNIGKKAA